MSEDDMLADRKLKEELTKTKYEVWKRHNIIELKEEYGRKNNRGDFYKFCRELYRKIDDRGNVIESQKQQESSI